MQPTAPSPTLAELYRTESTKILERFAAAGDGVAATRDRTGLVDRIVTQLYRELVSAEPGAPKNLCLVAVGGYGRQELYPNSDIDLLFLHDAGRASEEWREPIAALARTLWDLRLTVGHSTHTLAECSELHRDNLEFSISLLDARYLAGDAPLFARLHEKAVPELMARDRQDLVGDLLEATRRRHRKHGETIFHLEPNIKESPGGLRDYHVSRWLALIAELDRTGRWAEPEGLWPAALEAPSREAFRFLAAVRCFLHAQKQRDDNHLTYELQDQAAALGIGGQPSGGAPQSLPPSDWMRSYFRHARAIDRLTAHFVDDATPSRSSLYGLFQDWRSRLSNADFAVVRGRVYPRQPAAELSGPGLLLDLFEMTARHGLELSREAERWAEEATRGLGARAASDPAIWKQLGRILVLPHAPRALRAMHRVGALVALFPEFRAVDALVIRDFYHRYTVDEHSFMTIQNLTELRARGRQAAPGSAEPPQSPSELVESWEQRLAEVFAELERPELLLLALLFHDVGKGMPAADHVEGSLEAVERIFARLGVEPQDRETMRFLILRHLEMSSTFQRRDIFDPEVVRTFAMKMGVPERLKMLCLLTYADIKAVNPEALTPWKAEMLWRLYAAASNWLSRSLDDQRVRALAPAGASEAHLAKARRVRELLAASGDDPGQTLNAYLEGFPQRYLETHTPEEIAGHYRMARRLPEHRVELALAKRGPWYELTVVTPDRPFLFASLTGTLATWGMNILKADAFGNAAGLALDTFRFVDLYRTLELNPSEIERFQKSVTDVLTGQVRLAALMDHRPGPLKPQRPKVEIPTQIHFDDTSSAHSTLLELVTRDRPGLLYRVSSTLSELGCNTEVALIDTEGEKVIDVFYLRAGGAKLDSREQQKIRAALLEQLARI
jgi:[protein-PII] uridylyltransferase